MQATQDYTIKNPLAIADVDALQCYWRLLEYQQDDAGDSDGDNNVGGVAKMTMAVLLLKSTFCHSREVIIQFVSDPTTEDKVHLD